MNDTTPTPAVSEQDAATTQRIWEALTRVMDPELHADVVNLGLVYGVEVKDGAARVRLTFTSPGCPYGPYLAHLVREAVRAVPGVRDEHLELVFDPPWSPAKMSEDLRLELGFDV